MKRFEGFPNRSEATPLPAVFFSELLPVIEDLAELKTVLVAVRRIRQKKGAVRWVSASDLLAAPEIGSVASTPESKEAAIRQALAKAVERGVLLALPLESAADTAYFLNDAEGRRGLELVRAGMPGAAVPIVPPPVERPGRGQATVISLYEDTIGPVPGAGIAQELAEAEQEFPLEWLEDAFKEAAAQNVRRWAYVRAILARWREEGRIGNDGTAGKRTPETRYRSGKYGHVVRWK